MYEKLNVALSFNNAVGTTALVTSGVVLLIIGVSAMALASMAFIKARKIKTGIRVIVF